MYLLKFILDNFQPKKLTDCSFTRAASVQEYFRRLYAKFICFTIGFFKMLLTTSYLHSKNPTFKLGYFHTCNLVVGIAPYFTQDYALTTQHVGAKIVQC